jgi:hypothetical protein
MTLERILLLILKGITVVTGTFLGKKIWDTVRTKFDEKAEEGKA